MSSPQTFYQSLFADATCAGVYRLPQGELAPLLTGAAAAGCLSCQVELGAVSNKDDLLDAIARALAFPEWFGANWDALRDMLLDLGWRPAAGYVLLFDRADRAQARAGEDFATLLELLADVAAEWREEGVPFWSLLDLSDNDSAQLPPLPQPATP